MTHKEAIEKNGHIIVSPISGSMRPLIREHLDFGYFESVEKRPAKIGDVVLYPGHGAFEGSNIMHRIIGKDGDCYIIRGDNARTYEFVPQKEIFGVMTGYLKDGDNKMRSCRSFSYVLRSFWTVVSRKAVFLYRNSSSPIFRAARFVRRKISKITMGAYL